MTASDCVYRHYDDGLILTVKRHDDGSASVQVAGGQGAVVLGPLAIATLVGVLTDNAHNIAGPV